MAEYTTEDILELAKGIIKNDIPAEYTTSGAQEALRRSLIELNGGSEKLNLRSFRDNAELYTLVEKLVTISRDEGLNGNEFWDKMVETIKVNTGDKNVFEVEDDSLFIISEIGRGNQGVRRQRFQNSTSVTIPTRSFAARVYEHYDRIMSGRIDFNKFVQKVGESFTAKRLEEVFALFSSISATTEGIYPAIFKSGTYDEDEVLNIIDHVEADNNSRAVIIGARPALRQLKMDVLADQAKNDMYAMGYYGMFNGTPCITVRQRNKVGTHEFIFPQDRIYIIAGDDKPIKCVEEGDVWFDEREPAENSDLTREYVAIERTGMALMIRNSIGSYQFTKD